MAALGWLLNLDFAGGGSAAAPTPVVNTYTCLVNATPVWSQSTPGRVCP